MILIIINNQYKLQDNYYNYTVINFKKLKYWFMHIMLYYWINKISINVYFTLIISIQWSLDNHIIIW